MAGNSNVLRPGHHCQKILFHQQQEALAAHFDFTSFSAWPFLDSWLQPVDTNLLTPWVFWLGYILFIALARSCVNMC